MNPFLRSIPLTTIVIVVLLVLATGSVSAAPRQQAVVDICGRTPEVQTAILAKVDGATCSTITDAQLADITGLLDIIGYSSSSIDSSEFAGLTGVSFLKIADSAIETLHPGAFEDLTGLETLFLNNNNIKTLEDGVFRGLTSVTVLYLTQNHLFTINPGALNDLTGLETLSLFANDITTLDANTFSGLTTLKSLKLNNNPIANIHVDTFDPLTSLEQLALNGLSLMDSDWDEDLFENLTNLTSLNISTNDITTLDVDIFDGLTNLETLYIRENAITALPDGVFDGLSSLKTLYLNHNALTTLPADIFDDLTALEKLYLDNNSLSSLPTDVFDGLTSSLTILYVHRNNITSLHVDVFDGLTGLSQLALSYNKLTTVPDGLFDETTALQYLYLNNNMISSVPENTFDGLSNLLWLYLSTNSLSSLSVNLFDETTALQRLYLHNNTLSSLDETIFDSVTALQLLNLDDNGLSSLVAGTFDGLTALNTLYLNDNSLTTLDADLFDSLGNLKTLYLNDNGLTALPATLFEDLGNSLQQLVLTDNSISTLPAMVFGGLTGLKGLDLSCNGLTALNLGRFDPFASSLTYLDITGNRFTTAPTDAAVRAKLTNIANLYISEANTECLLPDNVGLSGLTVSAGTLYPAFEAPGFTGGYGVDVAHDATSIVITPTTTDPHSEVTSTPADTDLNTPGIQVNLPNRRTYVSFKVTAENGVATRDYVLEVFRDHPPATNARLRRLTLSGVTITEDFGSRTYAYTATTSLATTTVTPGLSDPDATAVIKLGGSTDADGTVDLATGTNVITVEVTAEDGTTMRTYTVTVRTQKGPDDTNAIWLATITVANLGQNQYGYDFEQYNLTDTAFTYLGDNASISSNSHFTKVGTLYTIDELYYSAGNFYLSLDQQFAHDDADNISVVVGGMELKFADAIYESSTHTYSWTMSNPSWSPGDEVKVKIVVLKDADGPKDLKATTTLVATRTLVPTTTRSEDVYKTYDMTLTWSAPTTGGAVTGYRVEYQPDPALQWQRLQGSRQTGTTYTLSGIKRSVVGYYRVVALRPGIGPSYSDVVRVQAEPETEEIPEEVGYLVAKRAGSDTALKLAWNRVYTLDSRDVTVDLETLGRNDVPYALSNRARATSYEVQYVENNGEYGEYGYPLRREGEDWVTVTVRNWASGLDWQNWLGAIEEIEFKESREDSPDLQTVVKGLEPGTRYYVRVRGCTDGGCSGWMIPYLKTTSGTKTSNATEADPLTATLQDIPATHDGSSAFTFRIAFSAEVTISPQDMRDHALTVSGGTVTDARRVDSRKDLWELTVEPAGTGAVSILALQDRACTETGALCTADGRMLSTGLGRSVPGPAPQGRQGRQSPAPLANSPATGALSISGMAQVGETLTADTTGIADTDGLSGATFSYQWIRNDGTSDTDIQNATGSSYPLVDVDEGQTIKVEVSFTDDAGNDETLTSTATDEVAAGAPTDPPGNPRNLTVAANSDGTVTLRWDAPNDDSVTGYQILRRRPGEGESTLLVHVNDTGSTATEYTDNDVTPDVLHVYRVKAINAVGLSGQSNFVNVTPTPPAEPAQNSPATGAPSISGTVQVGETLTADTSGIADTDGLTGVSYSYQWIRNDGTSDTDIQNATGSSYPLVDVDEGQTIKVEVRFTDDAGNDETLSSGATDAVAAPEPPAKPTGLSAVVSHDTVTLTWDNPQDDAVTGYVILRRDREIHPQGTFVTITGDTGSADTTYTDDTVEPDKQYVYRIKAINEHGEVSEISHWVRAYTPAAPDPAG